MKRLLPVALLALLAGCSSIPAGGDPSSDARILALAASTAPAHGRLALAPLAVAELAGPERAKGWRLSELQSFSADDLQASLAQALRASGRWAGVRTAVSERLSDAWGVGDELQASVEVRDLRTHFDGHNGWWIPNVVNFLMNIFPAWWVATEEYSLSLDLSVRLRSVASGAVLGEERLLVRVEGTFDEFDRGLQLLGPIWPRFDAETWRTIADVLFPALQRQVAIESTEALDRLARQVTNPDLSGQTLGLVVGLSSYGSPSQLPPLPYAATDARKVAAWLRGGPCRPEQVHELIDATATREAVLAAIRTHLGRARPGDTVVLYVAGYGTRDDKGRPGLLLYDADPNVGARCLLLEELAGLLGSLPGRKLLIVDAGFGSGGRAFEREAPGGHYPQALGQPGLSTLLAAGPREGALAPAFLEGGLFTYHLLRRLASEDGGQVALSRLLEDVRGEVLSESELLGSPQVPRRFGDTPWSLGAVTGKGLEQ